MWICCPVCVFQVFSLENWICVLQSPVPPLSSVWWVAAGRPILKNDPDSARWPGLWRIYPRTLKFKTSTHISVDETTHHGYNQRLCRDSILHISDTPVCVQITILKTVCVWCVTHAWIQGASSALIMARRPVVYSFVVLLRYFSPTVTLCQCNLRDSWDLLSAQDNLGSIRATGYTTIDAGLTSQTFLKTCVINTDLTHAAMSPVHGENAPAAQHDNHSRSFVL